MNTYSTPPCTKKNPRQPQLDRDVATRLAATEYERVALMLDLLSPEERTAPTDCPAWDVKAMAGHMLGMTQMIATVPEMMRQQVAAGKRAKRDGGELIDSLTALQVEKNQALTPAEVVEELRRVAPRATRARRRAPRLIRSRSMPDQDEWWTMGYLFDVILTRDPFLHRVDIARATGVKIQATAEHEGVIIDDVVAEWAGRHGAAYDLELTGPAGGHWHRGDGEQISMDAFEFCRALSGRARRLGC